MLNAGCFAAGTKLWTPLGYRNVEDLQPGEWVYARAEHDPYGPIAAKLVEAKFERTGRILHLHLPGGRLIRTTPEHPFFLDGKGWTAAGALQAGDRLRTDDGWVTIAEVFDTGTYEPVYNLRVAEYHTYFVGADGWGWALWAHNVYVSYNPLITGAGVTAELQIGYILRNAAQARRRAEGLRDGSRNIAAFLVVDRQPNGTVPVTPSGQVQTRIETFLSIGRDPHSHAEQVGYRRLIQRGLRPEDFLAVYTERHPCDYPSGYPGSGNPGCTTFLSQRTSIPSSMTFWSYGPNGPMSEERVRGSIRRYI